MVWHRDPSSPVAAGDASTIRVHIEQPGDDGLGAAGLYGDDLAESVTALSEADLEVFAAFSTALDGLRHRR